MKRKIRWTPLALQDLTEIKEYIQRDKPDAAGRVANRLRKSINNLSQLPHRGRPLKTIPFLQRLVVGNYSIYYRNLSKEIQILRIYHNKRRPMIS